MSFKNKIAIAFIILSMVVFIPGIFLDAFYMKIGASVAGFNFTVHESSRSVWSSIVNLLTTGNVFVGVLILLFTVILPIVKAVLLFYAYINRNEDSGWTAFKLVYLIGKWSMADVLVLAFFLSSLAMNGSGYIQANLMLGFYCFFIYCILSLIGTQLLDIRKA